MSPDTYLGSIGMFGGNFAVRGWAFCDGQLLAISQYEALFSLLGTTYGGDGRTTFALPDLRGRASVHKGTGPGLSPYALGQRGGVERNTEVPAHTHTVNINTSPDTTTTDVSTGNYFAHEAKKGADALPIYSSAAPSAQMHAGAAVAASFGTPGGVTNLQPFLAINYEIALQGLFPPRN